MEAVAMSVPFGHPLKVVKGEYTKAIGRLSTCVRKLRWGGSVQDLERFRLRLSETEQARALLEQERALDAEVLKTAQRSVGMNGADLADFARAMSRRGLIDDARRATVQLAPFDPQMRVLAEVLVTSHQEAEKATTALQDIAVDPQRPLRVRLLAAWWLATTFGHPDLGDDVMMSLLGAALRDQNWETAKRVLGAVRSILRIRTGESDKFGEAERPDFQAEFEQIRDDLTRDPDYQTW